MKKCYNCNVTMEDGNFCPTCGGSLLEEEPQVKQQEPVTNQAWNRTASYDQPPVIQGNQQEEMNLGSWLLTLLLASIPCVNLFLLFIWSFGSSAPKCKSNWAKAMLIYTGIVTMLAFLLALILGASMGTLYYRYYY